LADRHYSRQTIGASDFVPPGRCLVLYTKTESGEAFWVTSFQYRRYVKHGWPGAWVCSAFRNEGAALSSLLIRQAVAATRHAFGPPPSQGMVTFVDPLKVAPKKHIGWCFIKAGFTETGVTEGHLVVLHLAPKNMPKPLSPLVSLNRPLRW
jgi:hypothetical protein